jgi:hypothetical protein
MVSTAAVGIQQQKRNPPQLVGIAGDKLEAGVRIELTYRSFAVHKWGVQAVFVISFLCAEFPDS